LSFGFLFFLPWIDETLYTSVSFWPYFAMLFSIVVTASMITIIKLNNGKYIFEHFSYLFTASVMFIIAGILFVVLKDERE
jgi:surface polysaccharide O-acyltransferase-like enzyme